MSATTTFADLGLSEPLLDAVAKAGYSTPTPIQEKAIPWVLQGRDLLGCAQTGTGKTAGFTLPLIDILAGGRGRARMPRSLILEPTRELAAQVSESFTKYGANHKLNQALLTGGTSMSEQERKLDRGVDVLIATPGRLIDLIERGKIIMADVKVLVIDEADRMLDMGFIPDIEKICGMLPPRRQTLLFSATMPAEVEALAADYLNKPVKVKVGAVSVPTANVAQHLEKLVDAQKVDRLCELLLEEKAEAEKFGGQLPMTIVFVERKARADEIMELLNAEGVSAAAFHGGRSQGEREAALADYKTGRCSVLVATDVAARGLDVKGIAHVVNLDLPRLFEDYVHRVGRTGRAGMTGRATSFYTDRDSFLVAQIKRALQELENGNAFAFATGKEARAKEREAAKAWREGRAGEHEQAAVGGVDIIVDDKFKHMKLSASSASLTSVGNGSAAPAGNADDAFGSADDDDGW